MIYKSNFINLKQNVMLFFIQQQKIDCGVNFHPEIHFWDAKRALYLYLYLYLVQVKAAWLVGWSASIWAKMTLKSVSINAAHQSLIVLVLMSQSTLQDISLLPHHMSLITCHYSHVTCNAMSPVTSHLTSPVVH